MCSFEGPNLDVGFDVSTVFKFVFVVDGFGEVVIGDGLVEVDFVEADTDRVDGCRGCDRKEEENRCCGDGGEELYAGKSKIIDCNQ